MIILHYLVLVPIESICFKAVFFVASAIWFILSPQKLPSASKNIARPPNPPVNEYSLNVKILGQSLKNFWSLLFTPYILPITAGSWTAAQRCRQNCVLPDPAWPASSVIVPGVNPPFTDCSSHPKALSIPSLKVNKLFLNLQLWSSDRDLNYDNNIGTHI